MEDVLLNSLGTITSYLKNFFLKFKRSITSLAVFLIFSSIVIELAFFIFNYYERISESGKSVAEWGTYIVTVIGAFYAILQYRNHLNEERRVILCEYNQRYSSDKNIEAVVCWMIQVAKTNQLDGDIIGVNTNTICVPPATYQKEMFMRFFEELNLRLEKKDMNVEEVYNMFSYYALKFDEYWDFRLDINDYKNDLEMRGMHEIDREKFRDKWNDFHGFVDKMKEVEKIKRKKEQILREKCLKE